MQNTIRYFVDRDSSGVVDLLARIRRDDAGLTGEYFEDGQWIEHRPILDMLTDPSYGEEISEADARTLAQQMGWNI